MARRPKNSNFTVDDLIQAQEETIEALTIQLKESKQKLKELQERKKLEENQKVLEAIKESGKTIEEVLELLK